MLARAAAVAGTLIVTLAAAAVVTPLGGSRAPAGDGRGARAPTSIPPQVSSAAVAAETKTLRIGDRGAAVRGLQLALTALDFDVGPADGRFAAATRDGVVSFQQARGLAADGVVGSATGTALQEAVVEGAQVDVASARRGLVAAESAGRLSGASRVRYDAVLARAVGDLARLSAARAGGIALVIEAVAAHADAYDEPRALTLFSMIDANARFFASQLPTDKMREFAGADGVIYRLSRSYGYTFHPLANFAMLNRHVTKGRREEARRLAEALVARGVVEDATLSWEYFFPYGGPSRWKSGFAQGLAAESLARTAALVDDGELFDAAKAAFSAIPDELSTEAGGGIWVLEYGHSDMLILNAQLQTLLSLRQYVETTGDSEARAFVTGLETASRTLLGRFDRDCWSLYSLGGGPASPHYHEYHVLLLRQLTKATGEPLWGEMADRWSGGC